MPFERASLTVDVTVAADAWQAGDYKWSARATATDGWLLCDGSAVSRTTYADLFAAIGVTYGAGDGSTTFNVPFFSGRVMVAAGAGYGLTPRVLATGGGAEQHQLDVDELPSHTHGSAGDHSHTPPDPTKDFVIHKAGAGVDFVTVAGNIKSTNGSTSTAGAHTHAAVGADQPFDIMPPFGVASLLIKT